MTEETPEPPAKPSRTPSWVMLGFVLGALFVLALPRPSAVPAPSRPEIVAPPRVEKPTDEPRFATIDAVFALWGKYAVWSDDTTEVALWNPATRSFSDCYEVVRVGQDDYFRPIPELTRPILTHGIVENSPLQFTETAAQRDQWLSDVRKENMKAFSEAVRQQMSPSDGKKPPGE